MTRNEPDTRASQFECRGTEGLETRKSFKRLKSMRPAGWRAIQTAGKPAELLRETKVSMVAA